MGGTYLHLVYFALPILHVVHGCSNILVSSGASYDGNILVGDNDDSAKRHGLVTHFDGAHHPGNVARCICSLYNTTEADCNPNANLMAYSWQHATSLGLRNRPIYGYSNHMLRLFRCQHDIIGTRYRRDCTACEDLEHDFSRQ